MFSKEFKLDFEALVSQVVSQHGFLHYGYWQDGIPEVASLRALGDAQQAYFDRMRGLIPNDVKSILDVGSGTGSNAFALIGEGFSVECVCPSERLNAQARGKLPPGTPIHQVMFEDFRSDSRYDMLIFSESFHYIRLQDALAQAARYAKNYVLIFDYFRKSSAGNSADTRGSYGQFRSALEDIGGFEILHDEDVTEQILPTFHVLDEIKNTYVAPFLASAKADVERNNWFYGFLLRRLFAGPYRKLQRVSRRYQTFAEGSEYRLLLLKKSG